MKNAGDEKSFFSVDSGVFIHRTARKEDVRLIEDSRGLKIALFNNFIR